MTKLNLLAMLFIACLVCGCTGYLGETGSGITRQAWCDRDESMPWTGCWTEVARIDCESGQEIEPVEKVEEFRLTASGNYSVTWSAFESWVDYAGSYEINEDDGTILLRLSRNAPPDVDGQGEFRISEHGELILEDVWLGVRDSDKVPEACGHVFR